MKRLYFIFVFIVFTFSSVLKAQSLFKQSFDLGQVPSNTKVSEIKQDWKGRLWFANYGKGVTVFDGDESISYDTGDGLTSNYARTICFDENGHPWIGTVGGGISIFKNDHFISFEDSIGELSEVVFELYKDSKNTIWIGSKDGLFKYENGTVTGISETHTLPQKPIECITEDSAGNIWVGFANHGLYRLIDKETVEGYYIERYDLGDGLLSNHITSIHVVNEALLYIGSFAGLQTINLANDQVDSISSMIAGTPKSQVFEILESEEFGLIVAFGKDGIYGLNDNNEWGIIHRVLDRLAYALFEDREHYLWTSYWEDGVLRLSNGFVQAFPEKSLPNGALPNSLIHDGKEILLTYPKGVYSLDSTGYKQILQIKPNEPQITAMLPIGNDGMVIQMKNDLYRVAKENWEPFIQYSELRNRPIEHLASNQSGGLLITFQSGYPVYYFGKGYTVLRNEHINERTAFDRVKLVGDSLMWLASRNEGLIKIENNASSKVESLDVPKSKAIALEVDQDGTLWTIYQGVGLTKWDGKTFQKVSNKYGLPSDLRSLLIDAKGNIWVGSKSGVYAIKREWIENNEPFTAMHIGVNYGLPSNACLLDQLIEDPEGHIWIGTKKGIAQIDPEILAKSQDQIYPQVHVSNIMLAFKQTNWKELGFALDPKSGLPSELILPADQNQLSFEIKMISLSNLSNAYYRYRLAGLENDFSPITNAPLITYHDLKAGTFELQIKACDTQGLCSDDVISYSFEIEKPFYNTWWFYALLLIAVNLVFYLLMKMREKSLLQAQEALEQKVTQRTLEIQTQKRIIEDNNQSITDSIKYAKRIQRAIIPTEEELQKHFPDSFAMYLPKNMVSGDFYMMNTFHDRKYLLVSDCTGHGVPGALMSMLGYSLFRDAMQDVRIYGAANLFNHVSKSIITLLKQRGDLKSSSDGMDASLIEYEPETEKFEFVGANSAGFIIGDVEFEDDSQIKRHEIGGHTLFELKPMKQPLGINKSGGTHDFEVTRGWAKKGTKVYLMSDGYADQFGSDLGTSDNGLGKKFRINRLREKLVEIHALPMEDQHRELHTTLSIWKGALEQVDDITLIGVTL